jgi:nucleotide-binding universal stress UspA family protein
MSDPTSAAPSDPSPAPEKVPDRVFLVVVDNTPELKLALHYACRRAWKTGGRVALLYVVESGAPSEWIGVGELMKEESRQEGERTLQRMATEVDKLSGSMPILYVREGARADEVVKLIAEEPGISILVLGAAIGAKGPGPLVSMLTGKFVGRLRVPVTIVPGNLTIEDIEKIA